MNDLTANADDRARHPIAVVSERTGLSQDVLRVWERRYRAVQPERGPGGQRVYTDADLERLSLLRSATEAGRTISQVAPLETAALRALIAEDVAARGRRTPTAASEPATHDRQEMEDVVHAALAHARALDGRSLDSLLRRAAAANGIASFIGSVAAPLLRTVGDEWHAGRLKPAHEHLVSSLLHDIVAESMRSFARQPGSPTLLVATPAGDRHSIGAAFIGAAAAVEGWNVLYLGADLPAEDIADAAAAADARIVAMSVIYVDDRNRVLTELRALRRQLPSSVSVIAGGAGAVALAPDLSAANIHVESSVAGMVSALRRHGGALRVPSPR
jgi:DNA-binding transcriptional MerR regulator/methylmalonyl-CoA mutase cobalamin-binding subunit